MWEKKFRNRVFIIVYQFLFAKGGDFSSIDIKNKEDLKRYYTDEEFLDDTELEGVYLKFELLEENFVKYMDLMSSYLNNWKKTFVLTQAILLTFFLEIEDFADYKNSKTKLINMYLRLAQDYLIEKDESISLIHAVLSKIMS